jgi:maltose alpha-D-glucosyltransferase/alpha-amylase
MPGTPVLYYGDEIGMGDNVYLGDRNGVRTPMQWTGDRNAGFSRTDPARLFLPVIADPVFGYQAINVEAQERTRSSLLSWVRRLTRIRRRNAVLGTGSLRFVHPTNRKVLGFVRELGEHSVLVLANLSRHAQPVEIDLSEWEGSTPVELIGETSFPKIGRGPYQLALGPYMFLWLRLERDQASLKPAM